MDVTGMTGSEIVRMYRVYSEDYYAAGFMAINEDRVRHFISWVNESTSADDSPLLDYEQELVDLVRLLQ